MHQWSKTKQIPDVLFIGFHWISLPGGRIGSGHGLLPPRCSPWWTDAFELQNDHHSRPCMQPKCYFYFRTLWALIFLPCRHVWSCLHFRARSEQKWMCWRRFAQLPFGVWDRQGTLVCWRSPDCLREFLKTHKMSETKPIETIQAKNFKSWDCAQKVCWEISGNGIEVILCPGWRDPALLGDSVEGFVWY